MAAGRATADPAMLQNELLMELADDPIEFRHFLSMKKLQRPEWRQKQKEERKKSPSSTLMVLANWSSDAASSIVFHTCSLNYDDDDDDDDDDEEEEEESAEALTHLHQRRRQCQCNTLDDENPYLCSASWHSAARSMLGTELDTWQQRSKRRWEVEEEMEKKVQLINERQRQFASDEGEEQHQRMYEQLQMNLRRRSRTNRCWRTFLHILCGCFGVGNNSRTYY